MCGRVDCLPVVDLLTFNMASLNSTPNNPSPLNPDHHSERHIHNYQTPSAPNKRPWSIPVMTVHYPAPPSLCPKSLANNDPPYPSISQKPIA